MTMYRNTLLNLINPIISVDEYEAKSGDEDEIIVVAFEIDDEQPAKDLNKFIQRGVANVIDSDVSPNPNEHGKYFTFIEFKRNKAFYASLLDLIEDISNLTGKQKWKVQLPKSGKLLDLYDKQLKSALDSIVEVVIDPDHSVLESILQNSDVESISVNGDFVVLEGAQYKLSAKLVAVSDNPSELLLNESYVFGKTLETSLLSAILGEKWNVSRFGKKLVAENSGIAIILSDAEQLYR